MDNPPLVSYRKALRPQPHKRAKLQSFGMLVPLVITLLLRWADGQLSATDVVAIAESTKLSGLQDPEIAWLSNAGSCGYRANNCHRDIMNRYCADLDMPDPVRIKVPCKATKDNITVIETEVDFIPPHLIAHHLKTSYSEKAQSMFGFDRTEAFWQAQDPNNPKFYKHPMLETANWKKYCSPYILHADGASFHQRDSMKTLSCKPLLQDDEEEGLSEQHLYIVAFPGNCESTDTWAVIWKWVHWSMEAWLLGVHPREGPEGEELPPKLEQLAGKPCPRGGLWGFGADLDYFIKDMGMPANLSTSFCWSCKCDRSTKPWNDFRTGCEFSKHLRTPAQIASFSDHPCYNKKVGLTPLMLESDVMHTCEFGVTGHLVANSICCDVFDARPGDAETKFNDLWLQIKRSTENRT